MNLKHLFRLLSSIMPALFLTNCAESGTAEPDDREPAAYLVLSVASVEKSDESKSRANDMPPGSYSFEDPATDYEKIQTMRFIIVDADGNIEHNAYLRQQPNFTTGEQTFKVKPSQTKTIYLIGNEASIPYETMKPFITLRKGDRFPDDTYSDIILSRTDGQPLFSNTEVIPMTEVHKVSVGGIQYDGTAPKPYRTALFVTRASIKITFKLNVKDTYTGFDPDILSDIIFNQVADKEYLFPNNTVYDPAKATVYEAGDNSATIDKRIITEYDVPADAKNAAYTFNWIKSGDKSQRTFTAGPVYLPETKYTISGITNPYTITLPVNGTELTATLPNLPALPRNTHVVVNINLNGNSIDCTVDVVPYAGIDLNPDFGFDNPWIRPPYIDDERPPWADLEE